MKAFVLPVRVYYEDTDSGGVVYHANYIKFMERARTEWLRHVGFSQQELKDQTGVVFAVRTIQIDYHLPARLDDSLSVGVELIRQKRASLEFLQQVWRDEELLVAATVRIACIDQQRFRAVPIPAVIAEQIESITLDGLAADK